jgi:hypothetical protein
MDLCPYKIGDCVFYRPLRQERISLMLGIPVKPPQIGQAVKIAKITDGRFIQWEGYPHHSGGIHWTEFSVT